MFPYIPANVWETPPTSAEEALTATVIIAFTSAGTLPAGHPSLGPTKEHRRQAQALAVFWRDPGYRLSNERMGA
jgi:hypothetical protein